MKTIKIRTDSKLIPAAKERYYEKGTNTAILLLHGFTGSPNDMDYLAERIFEKTTFSVYVPRLPGHGTNSIDFRQSSAKDWLRKAYDSYFNLKNKFQKVYIGGLSMGGLLSILIASNFKIEKMFLISAALYAHNKLILLTHLLKYLIPVIKKDQNNTPNEYENEDHELFYKNYWKEHYTAQVAELHKLMRLARKKLERITTNTLILSSKTDELVPMKAAYTIKRKLAAENKKMIVFEKSPHVINKGPEKKACANHIIEFLLQ